MFIHNGGKEPRMVLFQDGVLVSGDQQSSGRPAVVPAPAPKADDPPAADKPVDPSGEAS